MGICTGFGSIVRLGSKSTTRTLPLTLPDQIIDKDKIKTLAERFEDSFETYMQDRGTYTHILLHIEFSEMDRHFRDAISVPEAEDGEVLVGKHGLQMAEDRCLARWSRGRDAGIFAKAKSESLCDGVWEMKPEARSVKIQQWQEEMHEEKMNTLVCQIAAFNKAAEDAPKSPQGEN
ncbi:uncharacterized protein BCR38DRAFT_523136 [Pseudomassariella vexata]|uniref:Uncharacterized protein n=1 Tax=Pseudomassariella vexata TaxID=1141098 RepID=A0A1Y2E4H3_9PEZI|nr:uncharacterized protein BCR38DRAFT_523136 [Pseudomassariella vexata]ORY66337.1 hypothetical protein BCR38DRAFT_523136 [Pseudomassariella vexata]